MAENRTEIKQREYLIGDMSEIVGVSRDTLRFYEKKGIIKARKKENGYRYYLEEDLFRLMVILYKRKMNDSLEEIEGYIKGENSVEYMKKHLQPANSGCADAFSYFHPLFHCVFNCCQELIISLICRKFRMICFDLLCRAE